MTFTTLNFVVAVDNFLDCSAFYRKVNVMLDPAASQIPGFMYEIKFTTFEKKKIPQQFCWPRCSIAHISPVYLNAM